MKRLKRNKKGFTLVEVIVVLVILAIIIALAVPSVMKYIDDANEAKYLAQARAAYIAADAEITKDYAPDKTIVIADIKTNVEKAIDGEFTLKSINAYTGAAGSGDIAADTKPSAIKSYRIVITDGGKDYKVLISRNGEAKIEK